MIKDMVNVDFVIGEAKQSAKSLRWLANMWPSVGAPKSDADRMCNCIHEYCTRGSDSIEKLLELVESRE